MREGRNGTSESTGAEPRQPKHPFVWSRRHIDAAVLRAKTSTAFARDACFYYLGDANFNVTTLLDTAGDAIARYVYSPLHKTHGN